MRARYWLLVLYPVLGFGLSLNTGDWTWMGWALPIALGATTVILVSGYSREFTVRRRWRQMSKLADQLGAREGRLVREHRQRRGILGYQPELSLITIHRDTAKHARRRLVDNAAKAGYMPLGNGQLVNTGDRFLVVITTTVRMANSESTWNLAEDEVEVKVCVKERSFPLSRP